MIGKIISIMVTLIGLVGTYASITSGHEHSQILITICVIVLIVGLLYAVNSYVGFLNIRNILRGAKIIGITNIKRDRRLEGIKLRDQLSSTDEIRIFAVSGNQTIEDFGREIKHALANNNASVKIIFSTDDDYIKESKNDGEIVTARNGSILHSCERLKGHLLEAQAISEKLNKRCGDVEVGFFKSHNRIPLIICGNKFGAFHLSVPPTKQSNETVYFEIENSSGNRNSSYLLDDLSSHFDQHWGFLKYKRLTGSLDDYSSLYIKSEIRGDKLGDADLQRKITDKAIYNFNNKQNDRNYTLGKYDKILNHHFGIGFVEDLDEYCDDEKIAKKLHDLELNQIQVLLDVANIIESDHKVLDIGCGRGGTSIKIYERFGCRVTGINVSSYQLEAAKEITKEKRINGIDYRIMNFLDMDFKNDEFDHAIMNEVCMYALNLDQLYKGVRNVIKSNGRLTIATWCLSNSVDNVWAQKINDHYGVRMHTKDEYIKSLQAVFSRVKIHDYSASAIDYFRLRAKWKEKSEIEKPYLDGFAQGELLYLFITADC